MLLHTAPRLTVTDCGSAVEDCVGVAGWRPDTLGLLEEDDVGIPGLGDTVDVHDQAVGLERLDVRADLAVRHLLVSHLPRPAIQREDRDGAVVGQQFGQLRLDDVDIGAADRGGLGGVGPLAALELGRVERQRVLAGVHPLGVVERTHVEVHEHAEAQVNQSRRPGVTRREPPGKRRKGT